MNLFSSKTLSVVAATVALSTATMTTTSEAAHALMITRTTGINPQNGINAPLAAPTVIDFDSNTVFPNGPVPNSLTQIVNGGANGGAKIQETARDAIYTNNQLQIGTSNRSGEVTFTFDDLRGMGYLGFYLPNLSDSNFKAATITFYSKALGTALPAVTLSALQGVSGPGNYFNFFVNNNNEIFNKVVFAGSTRNDDKFVIDNLAYQAIPTPALLPGLLALGAGLLRKRNAEADADA